ncbi:MAG: phosphocholine cytidylyltransferase family protein [Candidatus Aminicenantes bacterium]|nr:phosphocholine cytidylyltransferase family protein [Candidatus Aminicenantes bacterium]
MVRERATGVILCAGRGARLGALAEGRPKCLLPLAGRPILEWSLRNFRAAGIQEVVLVTGFRRDLVERFLAERAEEGVTCVQNDRYSATNTAFSFNLALRVLNTNIVLVNGDVLYDQTILEDLVLHPAANCVAVDTDVPLQAEEVKVVVRDGRVAEIGKDLDPGRCQGEAIGLYKVGRGLIADLRRIFDGLETRGEFGHFFEMGFERICAEGGNGARAFSVAPTAGRAWAEIDTPEDLAYAQRQVAPRLQA